MGMNTWTTSPTPSIASPTSSSLSTLTPIKRQLGAIEASDSGSVPVPSQTSETATSSGSVDVGATLRFYLLELFFLIVVFSPFIGHGLRILWKDHLLSIVAVYTKLGRDPDVDVRETLPDSEACT